MSTGGSQRGARPAAALRSAAREAFADLGWQATRVQDIVVRAQVSHGTFYHHYDNNAAVLEALVRESQTEFTAIAAASWQGDDVRAELERVIGGLLDLYERDAPVLHAWLHAAREERSFAELYGQVRGLYIDRVADDVRASSKPPVGTRDRTQRPSRQLWCPWPSTSRAPGTSWGRSTLATTQARRSC